MDFVPRYSQPFTLQQATLLDVPILSEEIDRLKNSLQHLRRTQEELVVHIAATSPPDPDLSEAFKENEQVIGSQEERIVILKSALAHKGASNSSHYEPATAESQSSPTAADEFESTVGIHL